MLNGYSPSSEEKSLPAIVPVKLKGKTFWAYLDTGSGRNFISKEAAQQLKLSPQRHESRNIRWPIASVMVWMDSLVALFWISSPDRPWKVFVSNRTRKIAEITDEVGIHWKYCSSEDNLADLGSRGATIDKLEKGGWFSGPEWLIDPDRWPKQPKLERTKSVVEKQKPIAEVAFHAEEKVPDEWDSLLSRSPYWRTLRVTAWALRFSNNAKTKSGCKKEE